MDDEAKARFELLKQELDHVDSGIRGFDSILFQVKGWCVTATVAIAGVALTTRQVAVLVIALGAIGGFWLMDGLYKAMQRLFIDRNREIEQALSEGTLAEVLRSGRLRIPGLAGQFGAAATTTPDTVKRRFSGLLRELRGPLLYGLYLMLAVLVLVLGAAMLLLERK